MLASHYKIDPRFFLEMPISEAVQLHLHRTAELEMSRRQQSSDE